MKISSRALTLVTAAVVVVLVAVIIVYGMQSPDSRTDVDFNVAEQPTLGSADAPVQIVVLEDFRCPSCRTFEEQSAPLIQSELIDTCQATMSFVNFPVLGPESVTAAIAGECVYQQDPEQFWDYKTLLFRSQDMQDWGADPLANLARNYLPDVNADDLRQCIAERHTEDEVNRDMQIARNSGASGTPTVFVNNVRLDNYNFPAVEQAVANALNE